MAAELLMSCSLGQILQGIDEQQVAGDDFRAIRPTYNHHLNWTAGHSTFELSLSDADTSPCEVLAAAWEQADEQKWKIVPSNYQPPAMLKGSIGQRRIFNIRVRRRDARFGLSLEEGRLALRLILPGSPEQAWKVTSPCRRALYCCWNVVAVHTSHSVPFARVDLLCA